MSEKSYAPLYNITDEIICLLSEISEQAGVVSLKNELTSDHHLQYENQIRNIHSSLAMENDSLSLKQVIGIINEESVNGTPMEIFKVMNMYETYKALFSFDPFKVKDILNAHKILMLGLSEEAGCFRTGGVKVFTGKQLVHMNASANMVPKLMNDLIYWAGTANAHPLIKSCVFHYEFEFINPFTEGSGQMGRMWLNLLLSRWKPIFKWLPIDVFIKERQQEYYDVLTIADKTANSTVFIEFMLRIIRDVLVEFSQNAQVREQVTEQVKRLISALGNETLSTKELLGRLGLKHRQSFSSIYLHPALKLGLIEMTLPDKPNSSKQKYRAVKDNYE